MRGHFILIPQDPGPLLHLLPSPELRFTELIKVLWLGDRAPTDSELKPFLSIRKHNVFSALQYLVQHNPLYRDVTIDHSTINDWPDEFIPSDLQQQIICVSEADHHERAGYTVDLQDDNYENDWQAAEDIPSSENTPLLTGSITTDINGERHNPDLRLLNAVYNLVDAQHNSPVVTQNVESPSASQHTPAIRYSIHGPATFLNHWRDPRYFTSAFPALFPTGIGGHLDQRTIHVSLLAFADWALRHHSRR